MMGAMPWVRGQYILVGGVVVVLLLLAFATAACGTAPARTGVPNGPGDSGSAVDTAKLFPASVNGRYGYIDASGRIVVQPQFEGARDFSEGLAAVLLNGKWGFIGPSGKLVIVPEYSG